MRIGLTTAAYYGVKETEDAAAYLCTFPFDCCEVFLETFSEYSASFGQQVHACLHGLPAVSMHTKTQHFEADLIGRSARQRADGFQNLCHALDAGQAFGASIYVYHGPACLRKSKPCFPLWADALTQAIAEARKRCITFAWENVSWCHLNHPDRVAEILAACPEMHFVLDVKQALETGFDPICYAAAMGKQLCHVHVCDFDANGKHAMPGKGCYDFPKLSAVLHEMEYHGAIILEPYADMITEASDVTDALDYLHNVFID